MKKMILLLMFVFLTFQVSCQNSFKKVMTFEQGFNFVKDGVVQKVPYPGSSVTDVTWESILNKPATFPPAIHTHSYNDLTDKPNKVQLQLAISKMIVLSPPKKTTDQINALTPAEITEGDLVYDLTLKTWKGYSEGVWKIIITDR